MRQELEIIGGNLRALRARHKLTQDEVADKAGLSQMLISNIESGKTPGSISLMTMCKIAGVFNTTAVELLRQH